jgi:hypothetical protein
MIACHRGEGCHPGFHGAGGGVGAAMVYRRFYLDFALAVKSLAL